VQASGRDNQAADLVERCGGIMRIGRAIIIPAILALGVAGSVQAGAEMSAAAARTPSVHVQQTTAASVTLDTFHND
jgi:hypothetical protein